MANNIFNTAVSALLANQRALNTVANNIANVNTEGYSRQEVMFADTTPLRIGGDYQGTGVKVAEIRRTFDQFINNNLTAAISGAGQQQQLRMLAADVDNLLANQTAGLMPALDRFFNALEDVATDPSSNSARIDAINEAESLAATFRDLAARLNELRRDTNRQIEITIKEINAKSETIARLNDEIQAAGNTVSNHQLDRRDQAIRELADLIGISPFERENGAIDIFTANGQALVLGANSQQLRTASTTGDPEELAVILDTVGGAAIDLTNRISGGRLTGMIEFRERFLTPAQNGLGRIALTMTEVFNTQHQLGLDLNGQFGGNFFAPLATDGTRLYSAAANSGNANLSVQIADVSELTVSDYELSRRGATYIVTRRSDGVTTDVSAAFGGGAPASFTVDGVRIDYNSGQIEDGDRYLIQPARQAASIFNVLVTDSEKLATAGPVRTGANPGNIGAVAISPASVDNLSNLPLSDNGGSITLTFDADNAQFVVSGGPGGTLTYDPAVDFAGRTFAFPAYGGIEFTISGVPADGDQLRIEDNGGAVGDNRNMRALIDLRNARVVGDTVTFNEAYGDIVAEVGARTRQAQISAESQAARLDAATSRRESVSGVNLDEEAAKLLKFQQSYQASARVVSVADEMFRTLLRAIGG